MFVRLLCVSRGPSDYPGALGGHVYLRVCTAHTGPVWDSVSLCPRVSLAECAFVSVV